MTITAKAVRMGLGTALCALLMACSPKYDWRTVHSSEGAYAVDYPARPTTDALSLIHI